MFIKNASFVCFTTIKDFILYFFKDFVFLNPSPMMVITQKLSLLAFSFNDGTKPAENLSKLQKTFVIK